MRYSKHFIQTHQPHNGLAFLALGEFFFVRDINNTRRVLLLVIVVVVVVDKHCLPEQITNKLLASTGRPNARVSQLTTLIRKLSNAEPGI